MVAVPLASSPYPSLAAEASHSKIVRGGQRRGAGRLPGPVLLAARLPRPERFPARVRRPPVDHRSCRCRPRRPTCRAPCGDASRQAQPSVRQDLGQAPQCGRGIEGSGFVYAPHRVLTNAHVVAGTREVRSQIAPDERPCPPPSCCSTRDRDVAVLDVPDLDAPAAALPPTPTRRPATRRSCSVTRRTGRSPCARRGSGRRDGRRLGHLRQQQRAAARSTRSARSCAAATPAARCSPTTAPCSAWCSPPRCDSPDTGFALTDDEIAATPRRGRPRDRDGRHRRLHPGLTDALRWSWPSGSVRR